MAAPYRIEKAQTGTIELEENQQPGELEENQQPDPNQGFKEYLERLLKMIPGEIVGLYMIGSGFIPADNQMWLIIWPAVCLILLIILRLWGTADPTNNKPSQPVPVAISAIAFVIWLYWLGGPFIQMGIHISYVGSLLVLVWSFLIPFVYKGQ